MLTSTTVSWAVIIECTPNTPLHPSPLVGKYKYEVPRAEVVLSDVFETVEAAKVRVGH